MNAPASPIPHFDIAEQILLKPHGLAPHMLERVFGQLFGHRVDYADLYFQYARSEAWSLEEGIVKSGSFNIDLGREDRLRLFRRHQPGSAEVGRQHHPRHRRGRRPASGAAAAAGQAAGHAVCRQRPHRLAR
jgi:hypothetical protein